MSHSSKHRSSRRYAAKSNRRGRSVFVLMILLLLWSLCLGIGLAQATEVQPATIAQALNSNAQAASGAIDVEDVPDRYQTGQALYLENCATCHVGIPPALMPTETWRQLLQDSQHYGVQLQPLTSINLRIAWEYLRTYSRPQLAEEEVPYRLYQSRYFKALHPKVELATRVTLTSCVSCHPGAGKYDFRSLSAEWQNAP